MVGNQVISSHTDNLVNSPQSRAQYQNSSHYSQSDEEMKDGGISNGSNNSDPEIHNNLDSQDIIIGLNGRRSSFVEYRAGGARGQS